MNKKLVASFLTAVILLQSTLFAATQAEAASTTTAEASKIATTPVTAKENTGGQNESDQNAAVEENDGKPVLTLDEAIEKGLKNNILFQQVQNKADIAKVVKDNSNNVKNDLSDAERDLRLASNSLAIGREELAAGEAALTAAQQYLRADKFPIAVTGAVVCSMLDEDKQVGFKQLLAAKGLSLSTVLAPAGSSIDSFCQSELGQAMYLYYGYDAEKVKKALEEVVRKKSNEFADGQERYDSGQKQYNEGQAKYQASLKYALSSVSNKLSTSTISSLDGQPLGDLIVNMSTKQEELTSYSVNIYRNQVALLVEKNYFEALKQQELLKVKQKAEERGRVQYEMAKAAFEVGMKSKDDMNIAKTYYDSTIMNTALQEKEYQTAMLELKKCLNMKLSDDFCVQAVEPDTSESFDLNKGIESGLNKRLEMKMAKANKDIYGYLLTAVNQSGYSSSSNQYKEVKLLQKQAELAIESQKAEVEGSIRESYEAVVATKKLVETAIDLRANAEDTVEMAKLKYQAGYAYASALLGNLNLGQMAGTMIEVLAAEENLANIEEKQIEAMNGYNLARLKYLNDIGELPYK